MPIFGFGYGYGYGYGFDVVISIIINRGFSLPVSHPPGLFAPLLLLLLVPLVATTHEIPNQIFIYFPNRLSPSRLPVGSHSFNSPSPSPSSHCSFASLGLSHNQMPSEPSQAEPAGSLVGRPTSLKLENIPPPLECCCLFATPFCQGGCCYTLSLSLSPRCVCVCVRVYGWQIE